MSIVGNRPERRKSLLDAYGQQFGQIMDRNGAELAVSRGLKLRRVDALMSKVVESSFDGIVTFLQDGTVKTANGAAQQMFGHYTESFDGRPIADIISLPGEADKDVREMLYLAGGLQEMTGIRWDGTNFPLEIAVSETQSEEGPLYVAIIRDITERKEHQSQLEHLALHDALTGLPNRSLLNDRLEHSLDLARRHGEPLALLLLDLDRFKEINDTLGHHTGDLVLKEIASRLKKPIRSSDTIARIGGDEFAVLLPAVTDLARAKRVAGRIVKALEEPIQVVDGLALEVGISVGIAMFPEHAEEPRRLMQCADVAMYTAKNSATGTALYDQGKDNHSVRHLTLTGELRQAIEGNELVAHLQPKIEISSRRVIGAEALTRWDHPVHGPIPPDEFIAQAERTGLIGPLARWSFETAVKQLRAWRDDGLGLTMAVNLSAKNLLEESLPTMLEAMLREYEVDPAYLTLEITESAIMEDPTRAMEIASQLARVGARLSIDDFGTGYSSLAYLRSLPVDELKIDRSFVMNMSGDDGDSVIVRSTVDLAHNLGLKVVAEGIESEDHIQLLKKLGCDVGQGYFIGQPMAPAEFSEWLQTKSRFEPIYVNDANAFRQAVREMASTVRAAS